MKMKRVLSALLCMLMLFSLFPSITAADGDGDFYLVGNMNGWSKNENYKFTRIGYSYFYYLDTTLSDDNCFKARKSIDGTNFTNDWWPGNADNYYPHLTGEVRIYLRSTGGGGNGWHGTDLKAVYRTQAANDGYYLLGSFNSWTASSDSKFSLNDSGTGVIRKEFTTGTEYKVALILAGQTEWWHTYGDNWYANPGVYDFTLTPHAQNPLSVDLLYKVSTSIIEGQGTLTVDKEYAKAGETVTVTACEPETGFVNGSDNPYVTQSDGYTFSRANNTFTMPSQDVTVKASFKTNYITTAEMQNGSVSVVDHALVDSTVTITTIPDNGYQVASVSVTRKTVNTGDGTNGSVTVTKTGDNTYTFAPEGRNGQYTYTVSATFEPIPSQKHTITVANVNGGTVTVDKTEAAAGETVTITNVTAATGYVAQKPTAYYIGTYYGNPNQQISITVSDDYTFTMVDSDVTVRGNFKTNEIIAAVEPAEGGSISVADHALLGESVSFVATPNQGYRLNRVTVTKKETHPSYLVSSVDVSNDTFTIVGSYNGEYQYTVTASFYKEHTVTITEVTGGYVVATPANAFNGEYISLTAYPAEGYRYGGATVTDKATGSSYVQVINYGTAFTMPDYDVIVSPVFNPIPTHAVSISENIKNGAVTSDKETAAEGWTVTLTVSPDDGYRLAALYVDGTKVTVTNNTATFTMGTADAVVTADFTPLYYLSYGETLSAGYTMGNNLVPVSPTDPMYAKGARYQISGVTLKVGDKVRVIVDSAAGGPITYLPDNDKFFQVDAAHAGKNLTVYFNPEGVVDWAKDVNTYFWWQEIEIPDGYYVYKYGTESIYDLAEYGMEWKEWQNASEYNRYQFQKPGLLAEDDKIHIVKVENKQIVAHYPSADEQGKYYWMTLEEWNINNDSGLNNGTQICFLPTGFALTYPQSTPVSEVFSEGRYFYAAIFGNISININPEVYSVTCTPEEVTVDKSLKIPGEVVTITVAEKEGYRFVSLSVKDALGTVIPLSEDNTTFVMPASNVTVSATYEQYVASIGETKYTSLVDAIAAVKDGETITVLADIDFSVAPYAEYKWAGSTYKPLEITANNVTLDLNEHTFSNMGNFALVFGHLLAKDGRISNATIMNGTLEAGKTNNVTNSYVLGIAGVDGATIKNVTTNGGINVCTASTDVVIDGCTVNGTKYYTVCAQCGSEVTIKDSVLTKNTDSTVATKAMFWIQNADSDSDLVTEANPTGAFEASSITIESGTFTVDTTNGGVFYLSSGLKPIVKGGTYNIDPTACLAEGYDAVKGEGVYTVAPHEHTYGEPTWTWRRTNGSWAAAATFTCVKGDDKQNVRATITQEEQAGVVTYTATVEFNGEEYICKEKKNDVKSYEVLFEGGQGGGFYSWGELCTLTSSDGNNKKWYINDKLVADGRSTYTFAVTENSTVTTAATNAAIPVAVISATLETKNSGTAVYNVKWSLPTGAQVISAAIYRGAKGTSEFATRELLESKGIRIDTGLNVRNGDFTLNITNLTPTKYQNVITVIKYSIDGEQFELVAPVMNIQANGTAQSSTASAN